MNFKYLTTNVPKTFEPGLPTADPIVFNDDKRTFRLIAAPAIREIRQLINEYAEIRLEAAWAELMETTGRTQEVIKLLKYAKSPYHASPQALTKLFPGKSGPTIVASIKRMTMAEQLALAAPVKPSTHAELSVLTTKRLGDMSGLAYLDDVLTKSSSAVAFFGVLLDELFREAGESDHRMGTVKPGFHQPRILEFLGLCVTRKWLLFPFVHNSSGIDEHYVLSHSANIAYYFNPLYRPRECAALIETIGALPVEKSTHKSMGHQLRNLIVCSTFRTLDQASPVLFKEAVDLISAEERPMVPQQAGSARRTYNNIIKLFNAEYAAVRVLPQLTSMREAPTAAEFHSFDYLRQDDPKWCTWANAMEAFLTSFTDSQGTVRRAACRAFVAFLRLLPEPPLCPEDVTRRHINDYTVSGNTFRNWVSKDASKETCNQRLGFMAAFFEFWREQSLRTATEPAAASWYPNPVDMKNDRLEVMYRAGTQRKAIPAAILTLMRSILVDDDYAWPKSIEGLQDYAHLVDLNTGKLEYVWVPSAAILLYMLLSLPLRGLQARLLDSGEGDAQIYDFALGRMVPNLKQLPVDGKLDRTRKEGFIQVMQSGMHSVADITGLWISTNKTSDDGYAIPWVSEELLQHLQYQRDWIFRFSSHPKMHGVSAAQGQRNTPVEIQERDRKFFCLFRDPSMSVDPTLPVSRQKLIRLWGQLCQEAQSRLNKSATPGAPRITLVTPSTADTRRPSAMFDLHTLRVSGITDLLDRGVPLHIVSEYVAGHATYIMTLWYDKPSPAAIREHLLRAREAVGDAGGPLPQLSEEELEEMRPHLIAHPSFAGFFTGFDALNENKGLILVRQAGICPGASCDEGGLDELRSRAAPTPPGDRGPSCPQCRFWLTGPAFLLGQTIEGNQLILKIRNKVKGLEGIRNAVLEAEDVGDMRRAGLLSSQAELEERQLEGMLTEWWHRMLFFEASLKKLDDYNVSQASQEQGEANAVALLSRAPTESIEFAFSKASELELKHFLSTTAEILPEFSAGETCAKQDIEIAIGKFLAMNDEKDLAHAFFKLNDTQRLTAANLAMDLMYAAATPYQVEQLIDGSMELAAIPNLKQTIGQMLQQSQSRAFTLSGRASSRICEVLE